MVQDQLRVADLEVLHDSELYLVQMDRNEKSLRLGFRNVDQTVSTLSFGNIVTYRINDIIYQNVVSRVLCSNAKSGFGDNFEELVRWTSSAGNALLLSEDHFRQQFVRIIAGDLQFIYVEPSWGAEIGVIAETASLFHDSGC